MSPELKESYHALELRPDDFERRLLQDIGFKSMEKLSEADEGGKNRLSPAVTSLSDALSVNVNVANLGFKRPLHVYHKAAGSWL